MALARDSLNFSGNLFPFEASDNLRYGTQTCLATQKAEFKTGPLQTFVGEASVTLSDNAFQWMREGPTGVQIGAVYFTGLPPGEYIVEAFSHNAISDILNNQYNYKTLFYGIINVDSAHMITECRNSVALPIVLNKLELSLNLILRVTTYLPTPSQSCTAFRERERSASEGDIKASFTTLAILVRKTIG